MTTFFIPAILVVPFPLPPNTVVNSTGSLDEERSVSGAAEYVGTALAPPAGFPDWQAVVGSVGGAEQRKGSKFRAWQARKIRALCVLDPAMYDHVRGEIETAMATPDFPQRAGLRLWAELLNRLVVAPQGPIVIS